jgi:hypothetical protein
VLANALAKIKQYALETGGHLAIRGVPAPAERRSKLREWVSFRALESNNNNRVHGGLHGQRHLVR